MRLFIVTLPKFEERYSYITQHAAAVSSLQSEIVGVDGSEALHDKTCFTHQEMCLSAGQLGCALGHLTAYRRMQELGLEWAVMIEDDAVLPFDFDKVVFEISRFIREGEVISLYSPSIEKAVYSSVGAVTIGDMRILAPMKARYVRTTLSYIIERSAARQILKFNMPVRTVADNFAAFYEAGALNHIRVLQPSPFKMIGFESTIGYLPRDGLIRKISRRLNDLPMTRRLLKFRREIMHRRRINNFVEVQDPSPLMDVNPVYSDATYDSSSPRN